LMNVNEAVDAHDPEGSAAKTSQRSLQAMHYLEEALRRKDPPLSEGDAVIADSLIQRLQSKLVLVRLVPADIRERTTIEMDGQEVKLVSDRFWTTPGKHAFVFTPKEAGYEQFAPDVPELMPGQTEVMEVRLPYSTSRLAGLRIMTEPAGAKVLIDGQPPRVDNTGLTWLAPGKHRLSVSAASYERREQTLTADAGQIAQLEVELDRVRPRQPLGPFILGGTGAALLIGSVATGAMAVAKADQLEDGCGSGKVCPSELRDTKDRAAALGTATDVLLIGGAAALAGGLIWYFFFPRESRASTTQSARLEPIVTNSQWGISASGWFR
jgi:hypothetical protein